MARGFTTTTTSLTPTRLSLLSRQRCEHLIKILEQGSKHVIQIITSQHHTCRALPYCGSYRLRVAGNSIGGKFVRSQISVTKCCCFFHNSRSCEFTCCPVFDYFLILFLVCLIRIFPALVLRDARFSRNVDIFRSV